MGVSASDLRRVAAESGTAAQAEASSRRSWKRLSGEECRDVVRRYKGGQPSTAIAGYYGVAKSTILRILRAHDVSVRRQPLSADVASEAAGLYASGLSLSQVAHHLDVNQETARVAIIAAGVSIRAPSGGQSIAKLKSSR